MPLSRGMNLQYVTSLKSNIMQILERWRYIFASGFEKITKYIIEDLCSLRYDGLNILKGPTVTKQLDAA